MLNVTQTSVIKQRYWMDLTLARSNGAYVGVGLNRFVHERMNNNSNVEVHLKTRSGNVNIQRCLAGKELATFSRMYLLLVDDRLLAD